MKEPSKTGIGKERKRRNRGSEKKNRALEVALKETDIDMDKQREVRKPFCYLTDKMNLRTKRNYKVKKSCFNRGIEHRLR